MGATLPIVVRGGVAETHGTVGGAGRLYAVNTFGAAVGAGLAGFVLLPALGMRIDGGRRGRAESPGGDGRLAAREQVPDRDAA